MNTVTISHGKLAGSEVDGINSFKGIPYAAPISGENRWLPPKPPESWSGTRDATQYGNVVPQQPSPPMWIAGPAGKKFLEVIDVTGPQGDDCLNLNVWSPSLDTDAKLPVMFYIHGGAYVAGANSLPIYEGKNLAKKGVVVVSINYRFALQGFFVAPGMFDDDFCGPNRGFEDTLAGLRWVQENIRQFGGDPDNVTIFGESAGGQSIVVMVASPASKGLFKRAIAQSGTPEFCAPVSDHQHFAPDLLKAIGIKPGDRAAISALTGKDTVKAMTAARKLLARKDAEERYGSLVINSNYGCVSGTEFMPVHLLDSIQQGTAKDIDLMIGTVAEDGRLFPLTMPGPEAFAAWYCMPMFKHLMLPRKEHKLVFERYKKAMPGVPNKYVRGQILTDCMFRRGTVRAAEMHAEASPGKTWLYQFNWSSPVAGIGSMHGIDIALCFNNLEAFELILGDLEPIRNLADTVSDVWVNFAKTGKPTANIPEWKPFDAEQRATMIFDDKIELHNDVDRHLREIWYG
ncbi:para-nitrobenzyl esterase [Maricurvus nonylphenolicus]|uniref:carboxylesterase/lipase family protein n=1 Tax=Maricurvus nonylphenolicus TaxID=1008307 RepID=UPI0036F2D02B